MALGVRRLWRDRHRSDGGATRGQLGGLCVAFDIRRLRLEYPRSSPAGCWPRADCCCRSKLYRHAGAVRAAAIVYLFDPAPTDSFVVRRRGRDFLARFPAQSAQPARARRAGSRCAAAGVARTPARAAAALAGGGGRTQLAATLAMLPLGVLFFSSVSLVGPLANALAIPVVSGLVTRWLPGRRLRGAGWPSAGAWLLQAAAWLTEGLLAILSWGDGLAWAALGLPSPSAAAALLAVLACALLLAPWPVPGRAWAGAGLLPLLLGPVRSPAPDALWLTVLDVGQGMGAGRNGAGPAGMTPARPMAKNSDAGARVLCCICDRAASIACRPWWCRIAIRITPGAPCR
jgi:hypothetical protein